MSLRRSFSWSNALRSDRIDPVAAQAYRTTVHAAALEAIQAKSGAKLWTAAGGFDRRAIMLFAHTNRPWQASMAEALTHAWACAHAARRAESH